MEQVEDVVAAVCVLSIQGIDPLSGQRQQDFVVGQRLFRRIAKVGQQTEVKIRVAIGQVTDLQGLDQTLDIVRAGQQGRHHHQGARLRRDTRREIQPW